MGYLNELTTKGILTYKVGERKEIHFAVIVNLNTNYPHVDFLYYYNGEKVHDRIGLVAMSSNLGNGSYYYFVCPITNKRCRQLYLHEGRFTHRSAIKNALYRSQTHSKKNKETNDFIRKYYLEDEVCEQIFSKHFKTHYKGKTTKRLNRLLRSIGKDNIEDIE